MSPTPAQTHIIEHPFASLVQGGRLDSFQPNGRELHLEVQGLEISDSEVFERDGKLLERVTARHIPLKLTFSEVSQLNHTDFFNTLEQFPSDDPSRVIAQMHSWKMPGMEDIFHIFSLRAPLSANMNFFAGGATHEQSSAGDLFTFERDWSPAPPLPEGPVPQPRDLHDSFGGDPVTVKVSDTVQEQLLFVGGLEHQPSHRPPQVNAVLNLGEKPSVWVKGTELHPNDRTVQKGEGSQGMSAAEIRAEADWVIDHLQKNESVLVHCVAGMNRSTTICCAVLMQLEGLTAEQALLRVREQHPWAKPDSYHWLALRWLEKNKK
ncbi:MAG TPA: dual specificity protein phosphatase [Anaerolineales bacterium]|nr:dual specificity protein phosphatase [Anaerolineales bacterium]